MSDKNQQKHTVPKRAGREGSAGAGAAGVKQGVNGHDLNGATQLEGAGLGAGDSSQGTAGLFKQAKMSSADAALPSDQEMAQAHIAQALKGVLAEIDLHRDEVMCAALEQRLALILDVPRAELLAHASERLGRSPAELMLMALDRFLDGEA